MKNMRYISNVSTLKLNTDTCVGCGNCEKVCPHAVIALEDKKARVQDMDACMECGACMNNCPANAIEMDPGVGCAAYILLGWLGFEKQGLACG